MANQNRERGALAEFLIMISVFVGFGGQVLNFLSPTLNLLTASVITSEERAIDSEQTPEKEPAAEADSFAEVAGVPQGIFNHGGSTTWAKIRENLDASNLENIFPEYRLRYTHPTADEGNPGSHTGIQMLLNGRLSFAVTSRPLREKEMDAAAEQGFKLRQQPVALDANVFVVHPTLDIPGLTLNQIRDIYTGKIRNWQDVGGPDRPITTYAHRSAKTGWFKDVVLGEAVHREDTVWVDTTEGIQAVAADPNGIYDATAGQTVSQCTVRPVPVSDTSAENFVSPYAGALTFYKECIEAPRQLNQTAFRSSYPFTRNLYVVYKDFEAQDTQDELAGKAFVDLLLSNEGQQLIQHSGFTTIRALPETLNSSQKPVGRGH